MTRIFDNDQELLGDELLAAFAPASSMDAAVGYFNLRGYRLFSPLVDARQPGDEPAMRILVGMSVTEETRLEDALQIRGRTNTLFDRIDNQTANDRRQAIIDTFRRQLVIGAPRTADFQTLTTLREHLRDGRVAVKLYTERPLHGKMYLAHTPQFHNNPRTGYVGSSNLTLAGLKGNEELSVDVLDHDGTEKLHTWFETRWKSQYCLDITEELVELLDESWVSETPPTPYELYLKVCYHLSRDAREGVTLYTLSDEMQDYLLQYQEQAVQILARRVHNRGGAMLGDVVGLGKTITAVATASMLQRAHDYSPLIVCPPNLVDMWNRYLDTYRVHGRVVPYSKAVDELPTLVRFGLVILDESHTLRSDKRLDYQAIKDYIDRNDARVLLLTATPYNTAFSDVSNQLSLYLDDDADVGFEPTAAIKNNARFISDVGGKTRTFAAFKKSKEPQDWSRLMGEHLVRRTRSYIRSAHAQVDDEGEYLTFANGQRFHFPDRTALPIEHDFDADDPALEMSDDATLDAIESLALPRNALASYWDEKVPLTAEEQKLKEKLELSRGNLMGIIRTNFYKRLSSAGHSFLLSLRRHVDRNELWLYALENGLEVPVGSPSRKLTPITVDDLQENLDDDVEGPEVDSAGAATAYEELKLADDKKITWSRPELFTSKLVDALRADTETIRTLLDRFGVWTPERDSKLQALVTLLTETHPDEKVLIFTEYRDTADYVGAALKAAGIDRLEVASGDTRNPTALARRFSPISNPRPDGSPGASPEDELRVLVSTDVLSEGQNLQDAHIIVNFDLPWAIIRLIQRAGRVDRVGQTSRKVLVYSFFHESVEPVLQLRQSIRQRLANNASVFGSDEQIFGDESEVQVLKNLYNGQLEDFDEGETVDAVSRAYEVWRAASEADPELAKRVAALPDLVYATRGRHDGEDPGVVSYVRTGEGFDTFGLAMGEPGQTTIVGLSDHEALERLEATPGTPSLQRRSDHFEVTEELAQTAADRPDLTYGRMTGVRARVWDALKNTDDLELKEVLDDVARYSLTHRADRQLQPLVRAGDREKLAQKVLALAVDDVLVLRTDHEDSVRIVCSLGVA